MVSPNVSAASSSTQPVKRGLWPLTLAATGVVFADIGTSPLYAIRETFAGTHAVAPEPANVLGVLSLVIWLLILVVSVKYVWVMMRADHKGEGGALALMTLVGSSGGHPKLLRLSGILGLFAAALFLGDGVITPTISALSAAEGIRIVAPVYGEWSMVIAGAMLLTLFMGQRDLGASLAAFIGPLMLLWFIVLAILGLRNIALAPHILYALSPHHAIRFLAHGGVGGFLGLGAVVLAITGCEALYTDMGLFGRLPIRLAWYLIVLPALVLNYLGQGALLLSKGPAAAPSPFFLMAPHWARASLLVLAMAAAFAAGQAVVSGAFAITRQAIQLGYLPRLAMTHTSRDEMGWVYVPVVNGILMVTALGLLIGFGSTANLASAYGVAVTGTMLISTLMLMVLATLRWNWGPRKVALLLGVPLIIDIALFAANLTKIPDGGWFALGAAVVVFIMLTTWKEGRTRLLDRFARDAIPVDMFLTTLSKRVIRVPGTAIFLTSTEQGVPMALVHNMKHNMVIHERVVMCTVVIETMPTVRPEDRITMVPLAEGFLRLTLRFGFIEEPNIPKALAQARTDQLGFFYEPMSISYFLSRETILPRADLPIKQVWRDHLFSWMARSAAGSMDFFHLPANRVVELGTQVEM